MELALPVLLKLFPNMLPSTFQDKLKHEVRPRRRVPRWRELTQAAGITQGAAQGQDRAGQVLAGHNRGNGKNAVLQAHRRRPGTWVYGRACTCALTGAHQATAAELYDFMKRVRSGARVSNDDIKRFAKLFNDEITLDSVDRCVRVSRAVSGAFPHAIIPQLRSVQLVNMCKFVNIPAYGTDTFLRYQLRAALKNIKADDRLIASEGVSTLTYDELRAACRSRGMRWDGESTTSMRTQLEDWLELSLGAALPSSLLILSRAFTITHQRLEDAEAAAVSDLEATLASLPDEVLKKVELEACATEDSAAQKLRRLESLRHEEVMIAEEAADRQDAAQAAAALTASSRDVALEEMQTPAEVLKSESQLASSAAAAEAAAAVPEPAAAPAPVRPTRDARSCTLLMRMSRASVPGRASRGGSVCSGAHRGVDFRAPPSGGARCAGVGDSGRCLACGLGAGGVCWPAAQGG